VAAGGPLSAFLLLTAMLRHAHRPTVCHMASSPAFASRQHPSLGRKVGTVPRIPPPAAALAAAVLQRALSSGKGPPTEGRTVGAATISLVSFSMAGAAASRFRQSGTTVEPFHPDQASVLVTSGANAVSRNPMYVGMAGLLLAHAVWRGSWTALLPLAGFVVFLDRVQIRAEEEALLEKFGDAYRAYQAATPRWLDRRSLHVVRRGTPERGQTAHR